MNNTTITESSINDFITNVSLKFHNHIFICSKVFHIEQKKQIGKENTEKKSFESTFVDYMV